MRLAASLQVVARTEGLNGRQGGRRGQCAAALDGVSRRHAPATRRARSWTSGTTASPPTICSATSSWARSGADAPPRGYIERAGRSGEPSVRARKLAEVVDGRPASSRTRRSAFDEHRADRDDRGGGRATRVRSTLPGGPPLPASTASSFVDVARQVVGVGSVGHARVPVLARGARRRTTRSSSRSSRPDRRCTRPTSAPSRYPNHGAAGDVTASGSSRARPTSSSAGRRCRAWTSTSASSAT